MSGRESAVAEVLAAHEREDSESTVTGSSVTYACGFVYTFEPDDDYGHARRAHLTAAVLAALDTPPALGGDEALREARGAILTALMVSDRKDMNAAQVRALVMPAVRQAYLRGREACAHQPTPVMAVDLHRDLVSRLGFGDNITEPMADNDTIVKWFEEQGRDASEWHEHELWRGDCYVAGHPDDEDCDEHGPTCCHRAHQPTPPAQAEAVAAVHVGGCNSRCDSMGHWLEADVDLPPTATAIRDIATTAARITQLESQLAAARAALKACADVRAARAAEADST